jgi:hypothetical protein
VGSSIFGDLEFALQVSKTREILGYGFQDMVSGLGISTLGPGKF